MADTIIKNVKIVSGGSLLCGKSVRIRGGKIISVDSSSDSGENARVIDGGGAYLSSGFIDLHVHGGGGWDFMDADERGIDAITAFHASHGTTAMLATTLTSSDEELFEAIGACDSYIEKQHKKIKGGSKILGIHLEGPYFALSYCGAQDSRYITAPVKSHYQKIAGSSKNILRWSAAPELEGIAGFAKECKKRGIILSMGHSACSAAEAKTAMDNGFSLLTHFYSAMSGVVRKNCYRVAGLVEAGYLYDGLKVEIIADGCHLPEELLRLIIKVKGVDSVALITDCSAAAGAADTDLNIGSRKNGQKVVVKDGVAFLEDMSCFAGSVATTDRLLETILNLTGTGIGDAVKMLTETPARILGLEKAKGSVKEGYDADLVLFDYSTGKVNIKKVLTDGEEIAR